MRTKKEVTLQARPKAFAGVRPGPVGLASSEWSFDGVLRRVIGFSRAATVEPDRPSSQRGRARRVVPETTEQPSGAAFDALRLFVRTLDAPTLDKLGTLMQAGRDGQALGVAHAQRVPNDTAAPLRPSAELFDEGLASLEYVQRGHAIACATLFDLEADVAGWSESSSAASLDERVWLRFGRELAASKPSEWSCLAVVGSDDQLEGLYLSRGKGAWWSFDAVIDRPSLAHMAARRSRKRTHPPLVSLPIEAVIGRRCRRDRRALRRAALAVSARLGCARLTTRDLGGGV